MCYVQYFKSQAKKLLKDFKTQKLTFDEVLDDYLYEYQPKFFDIDEIILSYDINEKKFSLMNAQHIVAKMVGYDKWSELINDTKEGLKFAKALFSNNIHIEDWESYVCLNTDNEHYEDIFLDPENKLEVLKHVFLNNSNSNFDLHGYLLNK